MAVYDSQDTTLTVRDRGEFERLVLCEQEGSMQATCKRKSRHSHERIFVENARLVVNGDLSPVSRWGEYPHIKLFNCLICDMSGLLWLFWQPRDIG